MAPKVKGRGKKRIPTRKPKPEKPGMMWYLATAMAAIGSIITFCCVGLTDWRVTEVYSVNWGETPTVYQPSKYGLYLVSFDGGTEKTPWYVRVQRTCAGVDYMAPFAQGVAAISLFDGSCDTTCLGHFRTRCQIYKSQSTLGYAILGILILSALTATLGVGWFFVLGKSPAFAQIAWIGGGVCSSGALGFYVWQSDYDWNVVRNQSQFPYPSLGPAFYATSVAGGLTLVSGVLVAVISFLDERRQWAEKQDKIRQRIAEETGTDLSPFAFPTEFSAATVPHVGRPFAGVDPGGGRGNRPPPPFFFPPNIPPVGRGCPPPGGAFRAPGRPLTGAGFLPGNPPGQCFYPHGPAPGYGL